MTLQQLEYIVAVDEHRHFVRAAQACGVTQSTLSSMISKLENEFDTPIFDRTTHPVSTTSLGKKIIAQARVVLFNASQIGEILTSEKEIDSGEVRIGIIPTVAPYVLPKLVRSMRSGYPRIDLHVNEAQTSLILELLSKAELDMAILATPLPESDFLEIPIYYEKFVAYFSPNSPYLEQESIESSSLSAEYMWILKEGHCLRGQTLEICGDSSAAAAIYQAGSIATLVSIVDENGGYTIIPELHIQLLNPEQRTRVRHLVSPEPNREISIIVRKDFVRERMLNIIASEVKNIIPESMVDSRLKKFTIKL